MAHYREKVVYSEEDIQAKAREDAIRNHPHPDATEVSQYERELVDANAQLAGNIAEDIGDKLEILDAEIKSLEQVSGDNCQVQMDYIGSEYKADMEMINNSHGPILEHTKSHLTAASRAFDNKFGQLGRMPLSYIPYWLYLIFAVLIGIGEVPLNAMVFNIFGENQVMTWVMSAIIGMSIPLSAHFVGIKIREHGEGFSWPNAFKALFVAGIVIAALYGLAIMRQTYLGEMKEDIGLSDRLIDASFMFFWFNLVIFVTAILIAYLANDPVAGYEQLHKDQKKAERSLQIAEEKRSKAIAAVERKKSEEIQEANLKKSDIEKDIFILKGKYDQILIAGQEQEARCLDQLGRDLAVYRQENLNHRQDGERPGCFNLMLDFPLKLMPMREKLINDA